MSRLAPDDARARFEALFEATRADLLAYLVNRCRDPEQAADLFAETYLTAWRKLDAIPPGAQARLWLFGVARNLVLKGFRQRRVADALVERLGMELARAQADAHDARRAVDPVLRAALAGLSERDREILTLTAWDGLTPREIATVMAVPANLVRVRLHRARTRVAEALAAPARGSTAADCRGATA